MKNTEFVKEIARRLGCTQAQARAFVNVEKEIITEQVLAGDSVRISGLLTVSGKVLEEGEVVAFGKSTIQPKRIKAKVEISDSFKANVRAKSIESFAE